MTIYLDLVLILNFTVDFLLLLGTNRLSGFPAGYLRSAAAAALGAVYATVCMLSRFSFLHNTLWRMVFLGLMGIVAFGMNPGAWKRTGIFMLLSFAMGGIALGIGKAEIPMLLLSAAGVWFLSRISFGGRIGGREYIPITVTEGDRSASVIALKDTGNTLRDPISGEQVLILGPEAAERLLDLSPDALLHPLETMQICPGLRLIPYSAVGQSGGMLLGRRFRQVRIGQRQCAAVIAFAPEKIGAGQMYQALAGGNI